jgi:hypothetical protein
VWTLIGVFKRVGNGVVEGVEARCEMSTVQIMILGEEAMESWYRRSWKCGGSLWNMTNLLAWEGFNILIWEKEVVEMNSGVEKNDMAMEAIVIERGERDTEMKMLHLQMV